MDCYIGEEILQKKRGLSYLSPSGRSRAPIPSPYAPPPTAQLDLQQSPIPSPPGNPHKPSRPLTRCAAHPAPAQRHPLRDATLSNQPHPAQNYTTPNVP
jgi:hypothetical protein